MLLQFGVPITSVPAMLSSPELTYVPNFGFSGTDSFTFESTDFVNVDTGTVFVIVTPTAADPCAADGREPDCGPGG
jgi:hypothetical protein